MLFRADIRRNVRGERSIRVRYAPAPARPPGTDGDVCPGGGVASAASGFFFSRERSGRGFFCAAGAIFKSVFNKIFDFLPPFFSCLYATVAHIQYLQTSITYSFSFVMIHF